MKKLVIIAVAMAMIVGVTAGIALAGSNGQGVPSAKASVGADSIMYTAESNTWSPVSSAIIKTSEPADLIISFTAECNLATDVKIRGTGTDEESISWADIKVRALVDGLEASPGNVTFAYRKMMLKGLLWSPTQVVPNNLLELPEQYIEIYEETTTASGFNFILANVGSGVHEVTIEIITDLQAGYDGANVAATIGKRTLVVESVRMVN